MLQIVRMILYFYKSYIHIYIYIYIYMCVCQNLQSTKCKFEGAVEACRLAVTSQAGSVVQD